MFAAVEIANGDTVAAISVAAIADINDDEIANIVMKIVKTFQLKSVIYTAMKYSCILHGIFCFS